MDKNVFEIMREENRRRAVLRDDLINGRETTSGQKRSEEPKQNDSVTFDEAVKALSQVAGMTDDQELIAAVEKWLPAHLDLPNDYDECMNNLVDLSVAPNTLEDFMSLEDQINEIDRLRTREYFSRQEAVLMEEWFCDEENKQIFEYMECLCNYVLAFMMEQEEAFTRFSDQVHESYMKWVETRYRNTISNGAPCPICIRIEKAQEVLEHAKDTYQRLIRSRDVVHVMRGDDPECYAHSISGLNALCVVTQEMEALIELMDMLMMLTDLDMSCHENTHYDEMAEVLAAIMNQAEKTGQLVDFMADRLGMDDEVNSDCLYPENEGIISICCDCSECDGCDEGEDD